MNRSSVERDDVRLLATSAQAERALGISRTTLDRLALVGALRPVKLHRRRHRKETPMTRSDGTKRIRHQPVKGRRSSMTGTLTIEKWKPARWIKFAPTTRSNVSLRIA
jgi:hypothetical protein